MIHISLCMIVKNEEKVLSRCLDSVKNLVDEIVIVDTGSSDTTKEIAKRYTDKIFDFAWIDDFSAARNFAFSKAKNEYCMWLDADDVLQKEDSVRFLHMKETLPEDVEMVMMPYETAFNEDGKAIFSYYRERIIKNDVGFQFIGRVHEAIPRKGKVFYSEIPVKHRKEKRGYTDRNLKIYEKMEKEGEYFDPRALYYYGRELLAHRYYKRAIKVMEEFLRKEEGWVENKIDATRILGTCYFKMGEEKKGLCALFRGFIYDVPRGETCCDIGRYFLEKEDYEQAIYWYRAALKAEKKEKSGAFIQEECYGFLPAIFLCVCYDRIGERRKARKYNELAGMYNPKSSAYRYNKAYFDKKEKRI